MKLLRDTIRDKGTIAEGNIIKVDSFLNHQIDAELLSEIGKEFKKRFSDIKVDKIITAEVSGIAIATMVAYHFKVPMVFARKKESQKMSENKYSADVYSYTEGKTYKIMISKDYIKENENILIIDDFLANGKAISGLIELIYQANANLCGVGVAIEKGFQVGGQALRDEGIRLESLAIIDGVENNQFQFR